MVHHQIYVTRPDNQNLDQIRDSDKTAIFECPEKEVEEKEVAVEETDGEKEKSKPGKKKEEDEIHSYLGLLQRRGAGGYHGNNFGEPRVVYIPPGTYYPFLCYFYFYFYFPRICSYSLFFPIRMHKHGIVCDSV